MGTKKLDQVSARKRLLSMPPNSRAAVLRNCGDWQHIIRHVLIDDMPLERYGKRFHCAAGATLDLALARLGPALDAAKA